MPESVPLRIYRNFLVVVEGQFGCGRERQNFVLDTGTAPSIINARLVRELGLTTTTSTMSVIGKIIPAQKAILPEVDLGPIRAVSLQVQVQDLSRLEHDLRIPVAGIIGLDVLSMTNFRLDYDKKVLVFGDIPDAGIPVSLDARAGIAVALVTVDGKPVRMLVDTGSDRVAVFGGNFKETDGLGLHNTSQEGSSVADAAVRVQVFFAPDIVFAGHHFRVEKAYFLPGNADPLFDGLLGVRALRFGALAYNRARRLIYLQK